jgi:catechol 2,3-dioxygenase-like lactoylglutathione lyase family enzyme
MPALLRRGRRTRAPGQILVIFVLALIAIIGGVGIVIDGGNAMGQQRAVQNGSDASAQAGTVVLAQRLMGGSSNTGIAGSCPGSSGNAWDLEVCRAVYRAASDNDVTIEDAQYTDFKGDPIGTVGGGSLPNGAQGVQVIASREFGTFFARALGFSTFTATTQATAVTGVVTSVCPPGTGCGLFPLTVPVTVSNCDGSGFVAPGTGPWPYIGTAQMTSVNEAIVPICKDKNSDIGGFQIAFYVDDVAAAKAYLDSKGVASRIVLPVNEGPAAGQTILYFQAPWGLQFEAISYPNGMAYEKGAETVLWSPKDPTR